jgi:hypothetical protein
MSATKNDGAKLQLQYLGKFYTFRHCDDRDVSARLPMHIMDEFWFRNDASVFKMLLPQTDAELRDVIAVRKFGAQKYGLLNYREGMEWSRLFGAFRRHMWYYPVILGEAVDSESGLPHLAHAQCCAMFLYEYSTEGIGKDDRELIIAK